MHPVEQTLTQLTDPRKGALLRYHREHADIMAASRGSSHNHQNWNGGYLDHIGEVFRIAEYMYKSLSHIRPLPFTLDSALIVLYFHDIEKMWKYTTGLPEGFHKPTYYTQTLPQEFSIEFSADELNALEYVHGEVDDYSPTQRKMGRLAAFCHAADVLSARMWFDCGLSTLEQSKSA